MIVHQNANVGVVLHVNVDFFANVDLPVSVDPQVNLELAPLKTLIPQRVFKINLRNFLWLKFRIQKD